MTASGILRLPLSRGGTTAGTTVVVVTAGGALDRLLDFLDGAAGPLCRAALLEVPDGLGEVLATLLVQVQAVGRLGEPEVGIHAGDHDPGVDREQLDADHRDPDVGIDDDALVKDDL